MINLLLTGGVLILGSIFGATVTCHRRGKDDNLHTKQILT